MPSPTQVPLPAPARPLASKYVFIDEQVYGRPQEKAQRRYFERIVTQELGAKITKWPYLANYIAADAHRTVFNDEIVDSAVTILRYQYFEKLHEFFILNSSAIYTLMLTPTS
ncbi:hypothetical protein AURDEDRAFT_168028 [Auricularia subglabra TFB-10046 SS5]|nr:hypothetical protein AURDEDRAFT_168028 [Auricularia subglabra TFB-10046 SS5]